MVWCIVFYALMGDAVDRGVLWSGFGSEYHQQYGYQLAVSRRNIQLRGWTTFFVL